MSGLSGGTRDICLRLMGFPLVVTHGLFCPAACGILVPWPGTGPVSPALKAILNHWTTWRKTSTRFLPLLKPIWLCSLSLSWSPRLVRWARYGDQDVPVSFMALIHLSPSYFHLWLRLHKWLFSYYPLLCITIPSGDGIEMAPQRKHSSVDQLFIGCWDHHTNFTMPRFWLMFSNL